MHPILCRALAKGSKGILQMSQSVSGNYFGIGELAGDDEVFV
jgi:hypothetical protein